jgi:hypothetical protein
MSAPGMGLFPAHIVVRASDLERVCGKTPSQAAIRAGLSLHITSGACTFRSGLARNPAGMGPLVLSMSPPLRNGCALSGASWAGATASALLAPADGGNLLALQRGTHPAESVCSLVGYGAGDAGRR